MRFLLLATDYDGTLASDGKVNDQTPAALERLRGSGRKLAGHSPEQSFYFRGPESKLNLRAQNLRTFLQLAEESMMKPGIITCAKETTRVVQIHDQGRGTRTASCADRARQKHFCKR